MLTASLAAPAAAHAVPAFRPCPVENSAAQILEQARLVKKVEEFGDCSNYNHPGFAVRARHWAVHIALPDAVVLIVIKVEPIWGDAPIERRWGETCFTDNISVVFEIEFSVTNVEIEFNDPSQPLLCVRGNDLGAWQDIAEQLLTPTMRNRIVTETRWPSR